MEDEEDGWMEVISLDKLANFSRKVIYYNFDEQNSSLGDKEFLEKIDKIEHTNNKELDKVLPLDETKVILSGLTFKKRNKKDKKVYTFIKESDYEEALSQINERMVSNIVKNLVSRGLVESAFDSEKNDFVFWVKKDEERN